MHKSIRSVTQNVKIGEVKERKKGREIMEERMELERLIQVLGWGRKEPKKLEAELNKKNQMTLNEHVGNELHM